MSLAVFFDGKLLSGNGRSGSAFVHLDDGSKVEVFIETRTNLARGRSSGRTPLTHQFVAHLDKLPAASQQWVRDTANAAQKRRHDEAPEFEYPRRGGLRPMHNQRGQVVNSRGITIKNYRPKSLDPIPVEKPPATIVLKDDFVVSIAANATYNDLPGLEVGKKLIITYGESFGIRSEVVGVIKEFTLHP